MAKEKPVFEHKFDVGEAIGTPWNLPGGRNFLTRIVLWGTGIILVYLYNRDDFLYCRRVPLNLLICWCGGTREL